MACRANIVEYRRPPARRRAGFMLIEAAIATVIVGVSIVAMLALMGAGTRSNAASRHLTRAVFLAQEMREMLAPLPTEQADGQWGPESGQTLSTYNDLDDFDGQTFSPPRTAQRQELSGPDWQGWSQTITVRTADPNFIAGTAPLPHFSTDMVAVTVTIRKDGKLVHQVSWVAAALAAEDSL